MGENKDTDLNVALLRKHYDNEISRLEVKVDDLKMQMEKQSEKIMNKLDVVEQGINNKLEAIDVVFRGNSRIGVFEQMRNTRLQLRILFVIVIMLAGFKVWGSSLTEWWISFQKDHGIKNQTKLVEPGVNNPNTE